MSSVNTNRNRTKDGNNKILIEKSKLLNDSSQQQQQQLGIGQTIQRYVMEDYNQLIFGSLIVLLIVLVIILYRRTFTYVNRTTLSNIQYYKKLDLKPLKSCNEVPKQAQYRLCDYYIASSYNTPAIGNQHFDYVSIDAITKALQNGARYIQLPICGYSVNQDTQPVIGTAEDGKSLITSLNTLNLRETLVSIRENAFKYMDKEATTDNPIMNNINYPLIIHIQLHTINPDVMDKIASDFRQILGMYLLAPGKYKSYPIQFEKLCKLLNKIVLICTPGYSVSTALADIVVPFPPEFYKDIYKDRLITTELPPDDIEKYFKELSITQQKNTYKRLDTLADKLTEQMETGKGISSYLADSTLSDRITIFNMFGMTLVRPMETQTVDTVNFNPYIPFTYGCQLIAMNYQKSDEYMDTYLEVFKNSSFILKPSGLRLPESESRVNDLLDKYQLDKAITRLNIIPDFVASLSGSFVQFNEISSGSDRILAYSGGSSVAFIQRAPTSLTNVFLVKPSSLSTKNDLVHLLNSQNYNQALTVNRESGTVQMEPLGTDLSRQSFYPEIGLEGGSDPTVSFRLYSGVGNTGTDTSKQQNSSEINYLGIYKNQVKVYQNTEDTKLTTLGYTKINTRETARFEHNSGAGFIKLFSDIAGLSNIIKLPNASLFELITAKQPVTTSQNTGAKASNNNNKQLSASRAVYIKDVNTGRYMMNKNGMFVLGDKIPSAQTVFMIVMDNEETGKQAIMDYEGNYLTGSYDGTLRFKKDNQVIRPAKRNAAGKIIEEARIGPAIGSAKYFRVIGNLAIADKESS